MDGVACAGEPRLYAAQRIALRRRLSYDLHESAEERRRRAQVSVDVSVLDHAEPLRLGLCATGSE